VPFIGEGSRNTAYFAFVAAGKMDILCTQDWLAERSAFELSVQVIELKPRRVRRLQRSRVQTILRDCILAPQSG